MGGVGGALGKKGGEGKGGVGGERERRGPTLRMSKVKAWLHLMQADELLSGTHVGRPCL